MLIYTDNSIEFRTAVFSSVLFVSYIACSTLVTIVSHYYIPSLVGWFILARKGIIPEILSSRLNRAHLPPPPEGSVSPPGPK